MNVADIRGLSSYELYVLRPLVFTTSLKAFLSVTLAFSLWIIKAFRFSSTSSSHFFFNRSFFFLPFPILVLPLRPLSVFQRGPTIATSACALLRKTAALFFQFGCPCFTTIYQGLILLPFYIILPVLWAITSHLLKVYAMFRQLYYPLVFFF